MNIMLGWLARALHSIMLFLPTYNWQTDVASLSQECWSFVRFSSTVCQYNPISFKVNVTSNFLVGQHKYRWEELSFTCHKSCTICYWWTLSYVLFRSRPKEQGYNLKHNLISIFQMFWHLEVMTEKLIK